MNNYAIRVSRSYADVSGIVSSWANRSQVVVVYQHPADEEVNRTHIHLLLMGVDCQEERLKRIAHSTDPNLSGNKDWSFKKTQEEVDGYIVYMTKGNYAPSFVKNFSPARLEELRLKWVELNVPLPETAPQTKDAKSRVTHFDLFGEMIADYYIIKREANRIPNETEVVELIVKVLHKYRLKSHPKIVSEFMAMIAHDDFDTREKYYRAVRKYFSWD